MANALECFTAFVTCAGFFIDLQEDTKAGRGFGLSEQTCTQRQERTNVRIGSERRRFDSSRPDFTGAWCNGSTLVSPLVRLVRVFFSLRPGVLDQPRKLTNSSTNVTQPTKAFVTCERL